MKLLLEICESPLGRIVLVHDDNLIAAEFEDYRPRLDAFLRRRFGEFAFEECVPKSKAAEDLARYFEGETEALRSTPLRLHGSEFQERVWQALREIPAGQTRTYGQLALHIGQPTAARAVGSANGQNPLALFVPCHRVIGNDGTLTGYAGGMERKAWILAHERRHIAPASLAS